jgi:hypothetical protein
MKPNAVFTQEVKSTLDPTEKHLALIEVFIPNQSPSMSFQRIGKK